MRAAKATPLNLDERVFDLTGGRRYRLEDQRQADRALVANILTGGAVGTVLALVGLALGWLL